MLVHNAEISLYGSADSSEVQFKKREAGDSITKANPNGLYPTWNQLRGRY